jgi:hypothetical protein
MVISKAKAGGFQYTVNRKIINLHRRSGNHKSRSLIEEIRDNEKELNRFKNAVDDID